MAGILGGFFMLLTVMKDKCMLFFAPIFFVVWSLSSCMVDARRGGELKSGEGALREEGYRKIAERNCVNRNADNNICKRSFGLGFTRWLERRTTSLQ